MNYRAWSQTVRGLNHNRIGDSPMPDLADSTPAFMAIPAGRHRLLAEIMVLAWASISQREDENLGVNTSMFLDCLREDGFHVKATGKQLVITVR
jgi:hypothetical protein